MRFIALVLVMFTAACRPEPHSLRTDFSPQEQRILKRSRALIGRAYYATAVTRGTDGRMRARVMEPFAPDSAWVIWLATNDRSRKVAELRSHPQMTLHYFDRSSPGYVSLYGRARLVNDSAVKALWRPAWEKFYPGRKHYLLIRFEPELLEMIDVGAGLPGDSATWAPYRVRLRP